MDADKIDHLRQRFMHTRRVICTGNPDRDNTLAQGFRRIFPNALFLCTSTGWDLTDHSVAARDRLATVFRTCNTFLNCSYIQPGVQSWLLDICHDSCRFCDVINMGSMYECQADLSSEIKSSKLDLRAKSLAYDSYRFRTCHLILGGIKQPNDAAKKNWLQVDDICHITQWIWQQPFRIPLMSMDQPKQPW